MRHVDSNPCIIYSLDKGSTTQKIQGKNIHEVIRKLSVFLTDCTTTNVDSPSGIQINSYSAYSETDDPQIALDILTNLSSLFGAGSTTPLSYNYPSGVPSTETTTTWNLETQFFKEALNFISHGAPWPKYTFGPVELILSYSFKLVDPLTKQKLPDQQDDSGLIIWFSRNFSCSPIFFFPFENAFGEFQSYLVKINKFLPFELKHKFLRSVRQNKMKTGFIYKKIEF